MYVIFQKIYSKYFTIFKKYYLIDAYGGQNSLHKWPVGVQLGRLLCASVKNRFLKFSYLDSLWQESYEKSVNSVPRGDYKVDFS